MTSANNIIADAITGHEVNLQRLSNGTVKNVLSLLRKADAKIAERLLREEGSTLSKERMRKLLASLRKIIDSAYTDATGRIQIDLDALSEYEGQWQGDLLQNTIPIDYDVVRPSADQLIAAANATPFQGRFLREWGKDLSDATYRRVRDTVRVGIVEGRSIPEIVRDLRGTKSQRYKNGVLEIDKRSAEAVVRTAVNHTANVARNSVYKRNTGLIKGVQYLAVLDGRTTLRCMSLDGKVFDVDKGPRPPQHMNCRSTTVPVLKSLRELGLKGDETIKGKRASMDGLVADDVTYEQWLRKKPAEFQDEVLGPTRGKLFRGGETLGKFVNRKGDTLTLEELRAKEAV